MLEPWIGCCASCHRDHADDICDFLDMTLNDGRAALVCCQVYNAAINAGLARE